MPLQELLRAIELDAEQERLTADRARTEAAATVVEQARAQAAELESQIRRSLKLQAEQEAERVRSVARLRAAAAVRAGREAAFASLLAQIRDEISTLRGTEAYPALFTALLAESRAALPSANELRIDPQDQALAADLARGLRIAQTLETSGGLELIAPDGRSIRNTLEERLANAEPLLRQQFARWLAATGASLEDGA
jgi:V/A-type H+/Na+-transporting ATPase subunit E